jgi:hypothetical protein
MAVGNYGTAALAQMASARQKFTNEQYAQALRDRKRAEAETARQQEMGQRQAFGMIGPGMQLGALMGGTDGMGYGALAGFGLGAIGELGSRLGSGENFGKALGHTLGRLPTFNEVSQIATGAVGGVTQSKLSADSAASKAAQAKRDDLLLQALTNQRSVAPSPAPAGPTPDANFSFGAAPQLSMTVEDYRNGPGFRPLDPTRNVPYGQPQTEGLGLVDRYALRSLFDYDDTYEE